ncbi:Platelet-activating factor acetylhydrolase, plasma/intracellular isoform II [Onchocerca flexuosa]|uniref:1-alkyl-2-acetylglycerophosphocholine esterase n=1 Tax=Onchocerca flexuosa TaxID=387005 RepID=A0A238BX27_9BILA|nr:Platelet-activating factor acetylhydrolase, plasma/intracellular isoform II [Onchocerca flexuosa]
MLPRLGIGKFEVGYVETMVDDGKNDDTNILLTIYYPADSTLTCEESEHPLWLARKEYLEGLAEYRNSSTLWLQFIYKWFIGSKRIPARSHLALSNTAANYPVLIFSHGLAACRNFYSIFCSSLASYGYVVAIVEHRDRSACWTYKLEIDETTKKRIEVPVKFRKLMPTEDEFQLRSGQLQKRVAECIKTLHILEELNLGQHNSDQHTGKKLLLGNDFAWSQFKGRLDIDRIFIAGHSFGGATAIATATALSTNFSAVVVLDGWMFPIDKELLTRVRQPILFLNAEDFQSEESIKDMLQVVENSKHSILLTLNDALHQSFTDFPILIPKMLRNWLEIKTLRDPKQYSEAVIELTAHFLKSYNEDFRAALPNLLTYEDIITIGAKFP